MPQNAGSPTAKDFESYVGRLYENLGFRVTLDSRLGGQQIDVFAESFVPGLGRTRLIVECKWRENGKVSNQDIFDFITVVSSLRHRFQITKGVMVTNSGFSADAASVAFDSGEVELLTIGALENQLFDARLVFHSFVSRYESSQIFQTYVPLRARSRGSGSEDDPIYPDIEHTIESWLDSPDVSFISILGDYGAGKTTLLGRLKYRYALRHLQGSPLKPFFVPLKLFWGHDNLDSFIRQSLLAEFEREIPLAVFWRALEEGQLLVFLDGFDEMAFKADSTARRDNFLLLSPLFCQKSKAVLTCRPSYFVSAQEHDELVATLNRIDAPLAMKAMSLGTDLVDRAAKARNLKAHLLARVAGYQPLAPLNRAGLRVVDLELFDERQIDAFLSSFDTEYIERCGCGWQAVKGFLASVYDLEDLMTRPLLLTMISETVLEGRLGINMALSTLGPASLYEMYTSMKLDIDWFKGSTRRLIPREQRALFAEAIAMSMFEAGSLEVSYDDLVALCKSENRLGEAMEALDDLSPALLTADIQVCTFLARSEEGVFRFSHRSFMEFFVARHLKSSFEADKTPPVFFAKSLAKELLYFLGGFAMWESALREKLLSLYSRSPASETQLMSNIAGILLYSGPQQSNLALHDTDVLGVDLRRARFDKPDWTSTNFIKVHLKDISINEGNLNGVSFIDSEIQNAFVQGGFLNVQLVRTRLTDGETHQTAGFFRFQKSQIRSSSFKGARLVVSGDARFGDCTFEGSSMKLDLGGSALILFGNCSFHDCTIEMPGHCKRDTAKFESCSFTDCLLLGLQLTKSQYDRLILDECDGIVVLCESQYWREEPGSLAKDKKQRILLVPENLWSEPSRRGEIAQHCRKMINKRWRGVLDSYLAKWEAADRGSPRG